MQGCIFYSHRDAERVDRLRRQLHPVTRAPGVSLWIDEKIHAGHHWDQKIKQALAQTTLFIFCISADLLFSEYIDQVELKQASAR
jgi:hypothetical protein